MTGEEGRKIQFLVNDVGDALIYAMKHWPNGTNVWGLGMLSAAALIVGTLKETLDADT